MRKFDIKIFDVQTSPSCRIIRIRSTINKFSKTHSHISELFRFIHSFPGYDEAAIEELRLNEGKQLLNDLKDSVENGRSLDIQDENGATAVSY